jgi:hypothetical protein
MGSKRNTQHATGCRGGFMKIMRGLRWICDLIRPIRPDRGRIEGGPEVEKGTLIDAHWR